MAVPELHFFAANDVNGATILEVPVTEDYVERIVARPALRELGYMAFRFSRQVGFAIFDSGAFQPETFVRLLLPDVSTTRYVWGCFLNDRVQQLVARVKAGENFDFGGPGPKHYLSRAILWDEQFFGSGYNIDLANGVYRWKETASAGRVLTSLINDDANNTIAQFLPDLTKSFGNSDDSNGDPWTNDIAGTDEFELRIGDDFLTNLFKIEDSGDLETTMNLGTVAAPTLELEAWQAYGRDLSGPIGAATVHFKEAVNILGDLSVAGASQRKASHVLVEGLEDAYGHAVRTAWDPGEYAKAVGISHDTTKNENVLDRYGLAWLRRQANNENEILVPHYPGFNQAAGLYFPGEATTNGHYWIGDTISLTTGGDSGGTWTPLDYRSEDQRVMAITMEMRSVVKDGSSTEAALSWNVIAELNVERGSDTLPEASGGGKGMGCNCIALCPDSYQVIPTSTAWKYMTSPPDAGWHDAGFNDSAKSNPVANPRGGYYDAASSRWIWANTNAQAGDGTELAFREEFQVHTIPQIARVLVAADNGAEVYINGTLVATYGGAERGVVDASPFNYASAQTFVVDPAEFIVGTNCISIIAWNENQPVNNSGPAAIYAVLTLDEIVSDDGRAARCEHGHLFEDLLTNETDTDLVLHPDGSGGVEWAAGGAAGTPWTTVIAGVDAPASVQAIADVVLDGTADQTDINTAISAAEAAGVSARILLLGTVTITAAIDFTPWAAADTDGIKLVFDASAAHIRAGGNLTTMVDMAPGVGVQLLNRLHIRLGRLDGRVGTYTVTQAVLMHRASDNRIVIGDIYGVSGIGFNVTQSGITDFGCFNNDIQILRLNEITGTAFNVTSSTTANVTGFQGNIVRTGQVSANGNGFVIGDATNDNAILNTFIASPIEANTTYGIHDLCGENIWIVNNTNTNGTAGIFCPTGMTKRSVFMVTSHDTIHANVTNQHYVLNAGALTGIVELAEKAAAPATPASGFGRFYSKNDGTVHWVNDAGTDFDLTAGSGAPSTADYLVGTAQGGLSAEIVVGTSPGGELGGTWASPTVDATHSGSAHHTANSVRKNSAGSTFTRTRLNLIEGTNVSLTVADDAGNDEVDVTIAATATGSGVSTFDLDSGGSNTTSTTLVDTNLALAVAASTNYAFRAVIFFFTSVNTNGLRLAVNGPAGATGRWGVIEPTAAAGNAVGFANAQITALNTAIMLTSTGPGVSGVMGLVEGSMTVAGTAGNLTIQYASETGGQVTIEPGSYLQITQM